MCLVKSAVQSAKIRFRALQVRTDKRYPTPRRSALRSVLNGDAETLANQISTFLKNRPVWVFVNLYSHL